MVCAAYRVTLDTLRQTEDSFEIDEEAVLAVFSRRLAALRAARGWTLGDAEAVSGVTRSYWRKLETGKFKPGLMPLLRIQRAFGLSSLDGLFGPFPTQQFFDQREDGGDASDSGGT